MNIVAHVPCYTVSDGGLSPERRLAESIERAVYQSAETGDGVEFVAHHDSESIVPMHNHPLGMIRLPGMCEACDLLHDVARSQLLKINHASD